MRSGWRRLAMVGVPCLLAAALALMALISGCGGSTDGPTAAGSMLSELPAGSLFGSGGGRPPGAGSRAKARPVRRRPPSLAALLTSRTKYERLSAPRAALLAREAFPQTIDEHAGGPPRMSRGEHIVAYLGARAAQVALPGGKHALVESLQPMSVPTPSGRRAPVDLGLRRVGGSFESARPLVGAIIPALAGSGVELPEPGLSLTPVDATGVPLRGSAGALDGAAVLYANTQTDTDTLVKPTLAGVEADAVLRSVRSPQQLYYRLGLPAGASIRAQGPDAPVRIVQGGQTLAEVRPASAVDAAGVEVPVSTHVSGDVLALSVAVSTGQHEWPIEVDPELADVADKKFAPETVEGRWTGGNWGANANQASKFFSRWEHSGGSYGMYNLSTASAGEYTRVFYHTKGESKVYKLEPEIVGTYLLHGKAILEFVHTGAAESTKVVAENSGEPATNFKVNPSEPFCANAECTPAGGAFGNEVVYTLEAKEGGSPPEKLNSALQNMTVWVAQEKGPELSFNETEAVIDSGRANDLYGSKHGTGSPDAWFGPVSGAFEVKAHDPGIGIYWAKAAIGSWNQEEHMYKEGQCAGVQCKQDYSALITYNNKMPDGERTIDWWARDLAGNGSWPEGELYGLLTHVTQSIKIDGTPPYGIEVAGWPASREVSAGSHQLTFEATDGTAPTKSSGVATIAVSVDGGASSVVPGTFCSPGPCTAYGKWTLNAEGLSEGVHRLEVVATDNAGNSSEAEFGFDVRHGASVPVGPGGVDPSTGQFKLAASDVSLAGAGSVSRVYESRSLNAGVEGPLGPQWALGLSGGQGLTVLPDGGVVLTSSAGATTTFTRNKKGEYESPLGDGNIKIEGKEKEPGKGITEYLLKETLTGVTTIFIQPAGTGNTAPVYSTQFGASAGISMREPNIPVTDAAGNVWVTDFSNARVLKFSAAGLLLGSYGSPGAEVGEFAGPWGIAVNQTNGDVYVTDQGNNRIDEFSSSGEFVRAFGWGVENNEAKAETCTYYCYRGIAGSGEGQVYNEAGVAVDASGNVWVADYGNDRIDEFNEKGEYEQSFGSEGTGQVQFKGPANIAFSGGNLYITDSSNSRVQEIEPSGKFVAEFGKEGTGNVQFKGTDGIAVDPKSGNLYLTDPGNNRVQEVSPSGAYIAQFGVGGSGPGQFSAPRGVAVGAGGALYITDFNNNRVEEWTRPTWLATVTEGGPIRTAGTSYGYKTVVGEARTEVEPSEVLAPVPSGVSCGKAPELKVSELKRGCRALTFEYTEGPTTAKGVNPKEWGEYKGDLRRVRFHAWNPVINEYGVIEQAVAEYEYDSKGRLRAEWDPRIVPALKTVYGYDEEGHLTSVSPPGQEPWIMHYGTAANDSNPGRLLSVARPPAASKTSLKIEMVLAAPINTKAPTLSTGSPEIGVTMSASNEVNGWSDSPLAYSYSWERCRNGMIECVAIPGAVNRTYTPQATDAGYVLAAQVAATNPAGTTVATSAASGVVPIAAPAYSESFGTSGSESEKVASPGGVATDSEGNVWVADAGHNRVDKFSASGHFLASYAPDSMSSPTGIAVSPLNKNIYVVNGGQNRIDELSPEGALIGVFGSTGTGILGLEHPYQIAVGELGEVWVADSHNNRVDELSPYGTFIRSIGGTWGKNPGEFEYLSGVTECAGSLYTVDRPTTVTNATLRVQRFTLEGKFVSQMEFKEHTLTGTYAEAEIACDPLDHALFVSCNGTGGVEELNAALEPIGTFANSGETRVKEPTGVVVSASGYIYVSDQEKGRIEKWLPKYSTNNPLPEPPTAGSNAVTTVEYHVPLSGSEQGLSNLTESEVGKWGQKDDPVEGFAVFPPTRPMGWPAKEYVGAAITYFDQHDRTVNVAAPTGGISTTEYSETNFVERTLSADNRATALKETKPEEAAIKLDTESKYENGLLVETLGPEHKVRLAVGKEGKHNEEAMAREHAKYVYDQSSPEGKRYGLVTETIDAAENASKEEFDKRITRTSYSGQENLGWTLRKPTSVTNDAGGLNLTTTTVYDPNTGNAVETRSPATASGKSNGLAFFSQFGSSGSENGQFNHPSGVAIDGSGNVWVADSQNHRLQKLSGSGAFLGAYGSQGVGAGQFELPWGIAIDKVKGNVYVTDANGNRVEKFNSSGAFVMMFGFGVKDGKAELETCTSSCHVGISGSGNGQFATPTGIAVDKGGELWVVDSKNDRVEMFNEIGDYVGQFGAAGTSNGQLTGPEGVALSDGRVYVTDTGDNRVEEFTPSGTYVAQWGSKGSASGQFNLPLGISVDPVSGNLYVADRENHRVEEFNPWGVFLAEFGTYGTTEGHIWGASDVAVNGSGVVYETDEYNAWVGVWQPVQSPPKYVAQFGSSGKGNGQFEFPTLSAVDAAGDIWVSDSAAGSDRLQEFNEKGEYLAQFGSKGTGAGQFVFPFGIAISPSGNIYVADRENQRVQEFSSSGTFIKMFGYGVSNGEDKLQVCTSACRAGVRGSKAGQFDYPDGLTFDGGGYLWIADEANNRIEKFNENGEYINEYGTRGSGEGQINQPVGIAYDNGNIYVTEAANQRVQEFSTAGVYVSKFGSEGTGVGQFKIPYAIAVGPKTGDLYVTDRENNRVEAFTPKGQYITSFGTKGKSAGQDELPTGITFNANEVAYVSDHTNARVDVWSPAPRPGNEGARASRTIYYSVAGEAENWECQYHAEWANLPCKTELVAQAEASGSPLLPITEYVYNVWDEATTVTETFGEKAGATIRERKQTYDGAGRAETSETFSTTGKSAPSVLDEYNKETGALETQSSMVGGVKQQTVTSEYNTLGQLITYTDGKSNVTKYTYEPYGRIEEVGDAKGKQSYAYDATTGLLTKLLDNGHMFTASYDVEGRMLTEGYPDGLTAKYAYNQVGGATSIEYEKKAYCAKSCPEIWFSDAIMPSIHGETLTQASTLSSESYTYDNVGRLTETDENVAGKGCVARLYGYDEESDRTSLTTRESGTETCPSEGGTIETHLYDSAKRLIDPEVTYDSFGSATKVPASDAGSYALNSEFLSDGQAASQEQNGQTIKYAYDPFGRTMETETIIGSGKSISVMHYAGAGEALIWTSEEGGAKWSRNVPGVGGELAAIETSSGTTTLQLHDLQGNIVATAGINETETGLQSKFNSTEFGVPTEGKTPPKYAWLGGDGVATQLSSGISSQGGASYVPQLARTLQTAAIVPPGAFPNGQGLGSPEHAEVEGWSVELQKQRSANSIAEWAAQQEAERKKEEQECRNDPSSCTEDPPPWSGDVSIAAAKAISEALGVIEVANAVSGKLAVEVIKILAEHLEINWLKQLEEVVERGFFGYSIADVEKWAFTIGGLLGTCAEMMEGYKKPHCWLYIPTVAVHTKRGTYGGVGETWTIPNFAAGFGWHNPELVSVGECPYGTYSACYNVNGL